MDSLHNRRYTVDNIDRNGTDRVYHAGVVAFASGGGEGSVAELMYGFEDISNQMDNSSKSWQVHYTIYMGCMIKLLDHLMYIQDVCIVEYLGGGDETVFTLEDGFDPQKIDFTPGSGLKSSFVISCGANFSREKARECANPMSLSGDFEVKFLQVNQQIQLQV